MRTPLGRHEFVGRRFGILCRPNGLTHNDHATEMVAFGSASDHPIRSDFRRHSTDSPHQSTVQGEAKHLIFSKSKKSRNINMFHFLNLRYKVKPMNIEYELFSKLKLH